MTLKALPSLNRLGAGRRRSLVFELFFSCPGSPVLDIPLELQLVLCARRDGRGTLRAPQYREALFSSEIPEESWG